nr:relaxase domain-containing protein [Propionibacterium sp.]
MSLHKITAGSGYEYLTRQVARHDSTQDARPSLASYYTERGEVPGRWVGSGLVGLDGLEVGDEVTAEQMRALFGCGYHPLASVIAQRFQGPGSQAGYERAIALGRPFRLYDDVTPFRVEVARRIEAHNRTVGRPADAPVALDVRAQLRTAVAREWVVAEHGREPLDERELAGQLARLSRQATTAVAGFDLTFSPVKSVSALWAVADPATAARIERAHQAAVGDALAFLEREALFTRLGDGGVRQVEVRGLIGAAFTHRDSRAGDPDLHTHVAVANKVQTLQGRWLAIDGRVLFKANVTASEVYNTSLERRLAEDLGVRFTARPDAEPGRRPVREIDGVHPGLLERWSSRRQAIETRRGDLAAEFQSRHGRPPTPVEQIALAQQATLDTRDAKHGPRTLAEQRATWRAEALQVCGGPDGLQRMIGRALHPDQDRWRTRRPPVLDEAWLERTAAGLVATLAGSRSTWQSWHVRAEAYRQARTAEVPHAHLDQVVEQLVRRALDDHSVPVTGPTNDPVADPRVLRRADGASVYSVAGARLFTSAAVLDAEQRLVAAAGRHDGFAVPDTAVELALLETAANGVQLNPGQAELVRRMATSGARLQVAIAPAGSGKTTAMAALARAWTEAGGTLIGLAPSAAAADQLRAQIDTHTDTLAKLVWHLDHRGPAPDWVTAIGPATLVVIDEAGMADTIGLDRAVGWLIDRGASVRLIGDDQQLAAIGAGGVLRDIEAVHGVLRLRDLVRFVDPAEATASLALRDGRPEALGFYLDRGRVHVGDQATLTEHLFTAWTDDRRDGQDSIMLAPTRDQVADLNRRARHHRLDGHPATDEVALADGNHASVGDTIITRSNDRRLRVSATDWVKNGDRWTVEAVTATGGLRVRHTRHRLLVTLPADYVAGAVELGYACTIHTAQGVSVDTVHGLADAGLARQSLYTMLTRGRHANHVYLEVVGDGSEHTTLRPETLIPDTPTDVLETILARDEAPLSASTQQRLAQAPGPRLYDAAHRYADALGVAAETLAGAAGLADLDRKADAVLPGLTSEPEWPALRTQLAILAADGREPITQLVHAWQSRPLDGAHDPASVLAWRLDGHLTGGPLPWLNRLPHRLADHPDWGPYLRRRAQLVTDLAEHVADTARRSPDRPGWLTGSLTDPTPSTLADVAVWRAAHGVPDADLRPTGPWQPSAAAGRVQRALDRRVGEDRNPALLEWAPLLRGLSPLIDHDPYTPTLARLLAQLSGAGLDAHRLVRHAAAEGPLPEDHAAGALWWRINRHLTPPTLRSLDVDTRIPTDWTTALADHVGVPLARELQDSPYWTALVHAIEDGLQRGWTLPALLAEARPEQPAGTVDAAQALTWRISVATDPSSHTDDTVPADPADPTPPEDLYDGYTPTEPDPADQPAARVDADPWDDLDLGLEALIRASLPAPEPTAVQIREQLDRRDAWHDSPAGPDRLAQINALAADFFTARYATSWAREYLTGRFGVDLSGDPVHRPGYAPDGWTGLIDHLRRHGVTDAELAAAGLTVTTSAGRLIDRFRDRVVFPITNPDGLILGFVGRRNPTRDHDPKTPKYLNTPDTALFHKSGQLFLPHRLLPDGGTPVIVEGPMDAVAVTLASQGRYLGVAPLGTALTDEQARQLHTLGRPPIIATDNDPAGTAATERDYWQLVPYRIVPRHAQLPAGCDPADLVAQHHGDHLVDALDQAGLLAHELLLRRLTDLPQQLALDPALRVIAAQPPEHWTVGETALTTATGNPAVHVRLALKDHITAFNHDPRAAAQAAHDQIRALYRRLDQARHPAPSAETPPAPATRPVVEHTSRPPEPVPTTRPRPGPRR